MREVAFVLGLKGYAQGGRKAVSKALKKYGVALALCESVLQYGLT